MINWAMDYWYLCLAALLIGIATAAWIWLALRPAAPARDIDELPAGAPAPRLEPRKPDVTLATAADFSAVPAAAPAAAPVAAAADDGAARPRIAAAVGAPDDLTLIKGVGPKLNTLLGSLGVSRFDQIAAWSAADIAEVDQYLGTFKGRIERDSWVEQAGYLARGDTAAFAAKFGAVGSENR